MGDGSGCGVEFEPLEGGKAPDELLSDLSLGRLARDPTSSTILPPQELKKDNTNVSTGATRK
jgi:hypothetical protein